MTRDEFRRQSLRREIDFVTAALDDEHHRTRAIVIGPWRCSCGAAYRDAGRMWDHAQECSGKRSRYLDGIEPWPATEEHVA